MVKLRLKYKQAGIIAFIFALLIFSVSTIFYPLEIFIADPVEIVTTDIENNDTVKEVKSEKKEIYSTISLFSSIHEFSFFGQHYNTSVLTGNPLVVDSPPPEIKIKLSELLSRKI